MNKSISTIVIFLVWFSVSFSQSHNYSVSLIPDSLKENADAVIRYSNQELVIKDIENAVLKVKKVITILKKSGGKHAKLYVNYDKFDRINYIEGRIYDKFGKLIRKLKKNDIKDISKYDGFSLYTDNRLKFIGKPVLTPPYTVEYEYEKKIKGLYGVPGWYPVLNENIAVENAYFSIQYPNTVRVHTKKINCEDVIIDNLYLDADNLKTYHLKNYKAIKTETFNNNYYNYMPIVKHRLSDFILDGYKGNSDSWENLGAWKNKLLNGKDEIPEKTHIEIINLIKAIKTDKEKAKLIYEYIQSKTRYVSIQEGIGGLQPFSAETVDKTGYGDCKALSNYTMSLLKLAGIKSHYTSVYAGNDYPDIFKDFPSHQSNHIILCVPIENDTIWLECTSQTAPFGYIGTFTDDRDVLIIDSDGKGKLAHTTVYPEEVNTQFRYAEIDLDETGSLKSEVKTVYAGLQYENVWRILDLSDEEKEKKLNKRIALPNMKINKFLFVNNKDIIPSVEENLEISIKNYASVSSDRMFLLPNILNRKEYIPRKIESRKTEIVFRRGFTDIDTIIYNIPEGFKIEYIPENITENNKFGNYEVFYYFEDSKFIYIRKFIKHKGTFPPEDYGDLRNFFKLMYNTDKKTIVFVKNQ